MLPSDLRHRPDVPVDRERQPDRVARRRVGVLPDDQHPDLATSAARTRAAPAARPAGRSGRPPPRRAGSRPSRRSVGDRLQRGRPVVIDDRRSGAGMAAGYAGRGWSGSPLGAAPARTGGRSAEVVPAARRRAGLHRRPRRPLPATTAADRGPPRRQLRAVREGRRQRVVVTAGQRPLQVVPAERRGHLDQPRVHRQRRRSRTSIATPGGRGDVPEVGQQAVGDVDHRRGARRRRRRARPASGGSGTR